MTHNNNVEQVWNVDEAVDEFKELLGYVSMFDKINQFIESGKSAFIIREVDTSRAEITGKIFVTYKLADELKILLSTARTSNIEPEIV